MKEEIFNDQKGNLQDAQCSINKRYGGLTLMDPKSPTRLELKV